MHKSCLLAMLLLGAGALGSVSAFERTEIAERLGYADLMNLNQAVALYEDGELVRARNAFRHLAELGDAQARLNLAAMLMRDEGGAGDKEEGLAWLQWAADQGLEAAVAARETLTDLYTEESSPAAQTRLQVLRQQHQPELPAGAQGVERYPIGTCSFENLKTVNPTYPRSLARSGRVGTVDLWLMFSPDGDVVLVDPQDNPSEDRALLETATRAIRQWRFEDCELGNYPLLQQSISFEIDRRYTRATRDRIAERLVQAQSGNIAEAFALWKLNKTYAGLVGLDEEGATSLLRNAAVGGFPAARYEYAMQLRRSNFEDHSRRMLILAAMDGHPQSLHHLAGVYAEQASTALQLHMLAAESGGPLQVFHAARSLLLNADRALRDPARALELTSALHEDQLKHNPILAEIHALALAQSGQMQEAARWQQRAVDQLREQGSDASTANSRLLSYRDGKLPEQPPGKLPTDDALESV